MSIPSTAGLDTGTWTLDPLRSSVEFQVRMLYGLMTVKGRFDRYHGTLNLSERPAIALTIEAASLNTDNDRRDTHLRSPDFFDVAHHPEIRFESDAADLADGTLKVRGLLYAAGGYTPVDVDAVVREAGDELEIEATALVDQRELGMTWSPLRVISVPSRLTVRGRLDRISRSLR